MCEKMDEMKTGPGPLNLNDGWEQQVSENAQRQAANQEKKSRQRAEAEARRQEMKRANRTLSLVCVALALIAAGGIYMNCIENVPIWLGASSAVSGVAILFFMLGVVVGRRHC